MANYFDLTVNGGLLKTTTAERADVEQLAAWAEYELISSYTAPQADRTGSPLEGTSRIVTGLENLTSGAGEPVVYLRYYKADPDDLTSTAEVAFKTAMQYAIAALIEARAAQADRDPAVIEETRGRRRVRYATGANVWENSIPKRVRSILSPYDVRPVAVAI